MRPLPNVTSDTETDKDKQLIDKLVDQTFKRMQMGYEGDIETASNDAIQSFLNDPNQSVEDLPYDTIEKTESKIRERVEDDLPEEFEYELDYNHNQEAILRVSTGCPNCGNTAVFNGILIEENQWVGTTSEDGETIHRVDDTTNSEVKYLGCGACSEVLVRKMT